METECPLYWLVALCGARERKSSGLTHGREEEMEESRESDAEYSLTGRERGD